MQKCLEDNDILMYLTNNEGKSTVAERITITLNCKICRKWQLITNKVNLILINWIR